MFIAAASLTRDHQQMVYGSSYEERWAAMLDALEISQPGQLATLVGVSPQSVNNWISRARIGNTSRKQFQARTGISVDWVNDGAGDMWLNQPAAAREERAAAYFRPITLWDNPADLSPDQFVMLPTLNYRLSAGNGGPDPEAAEFSDRSAAFRADFAAAHGWSPRTHFTMRAEGESMEPTIQDGAPVVVATNETSIRSGRIYAILIGKEPFLKRLDKLPGGLIRVRSDNTSDPAFAAYEVPESSLKVIGRAVWTPVVL